jgi:hypothetical protein
MHVTCFDGCPESAVHDEGLQPVGLVEMQMICYCAKKIVGWSFLQTGPLAMSQVQCNLLQVLKDQTWEAV